MGDNLGKKRHIAADSLARERITQRLDVAREEFSRREPGDISVVTCNPGEQAWGNQSLGKGYGRHVSQHY